MTARRDPFAIRKARRPPGPAETRHEVPVALPDGCVIAVPGGSEEQLLVVARAARSVAGNGPVLAITGRSPTTLSAHSIDLVAEAQPEVLPALFEKIRPKAIVLPEDGGAYSDLGRRLAFDLGLKIAVRVVGIEAGSVRCATNLPGREVIAALPEILLIDRRLSVPAVDPRQTRAAVLPALRTAETDGPRRIRTIETEPDALALPDARFVVSAGSGIRDLGLFHRFVSALGATPGASRVLVDSGLMPRDRQVGTSGASTAAHLYVALGISGAVQHLEGINDCRRVIAVNTDKACPMAMRADLTLQGDAETFMRCVLDRLERDE